MRTHSQIVKEFGASAMVRALAGVGIEVHQSTPQRWSERDSIPGEYWQALNDLKIASIEELAQAADPRKQDAAA